MNQRSQTGTGRIGEGTKELLQGVVGGTASSTSKFAHALDRVVRSAGGLESSSETMEHTKVRACVRACDARHKSIEQSERF